LRALSQLSYDPTLQKKAFGRRAFRPSGQFPADGSAFLSHKVTGPMPKSCDEEISEKNTFPSKRGAVPVEKKTATSFQRRMRFRASSVVLDAVADSRS